MKLINIINDKGSIKNIKLLKYNFFENKNDEDVI